MALAYGVSGMTFTGADLPGFMGNPTDDIFIEEYMAGVFYPFMRAHATIDNAGVREPWLRSQAVQTAVRNSLHQRYAQSHYLYTTFKYATETGCPIIRPMWYEFPQDLATFTLDKQFMFGDSFLVSPKIYPHLHPDLNAPVNTQVYLPVGTNWYNMYSGISQPGSSEV
jgi:mannosyl-oligosaccharide alpha-1,3-glucosidase